MTFDPVKINLQQSQCEHGGRISVCVTTKLCFTYSIKSDQQDLNADAGELFSIILLPPHCQICCILLFYAFYICRVLQRSATVWLWMLCVQRPGLHLLAWTIKVIGGLPSASSSKTERQNVCQKSSWCRQVLLSLWCTHGVSYGSLLVRNPPQNYIFSPVFRSAECLQFLRRSFMKVIF